MPPIIESNKALHGLPKTSQYFQEFLSKGFLKLRFVRKISDQQLFVRRRKGSIFYLSAHSDHYLVVACTKDSHLNCRVRE
jgi:hypothetical protein